MPGSSSVVAQISPSERSTSLPTDTSPAKPTPRALPRESSAPIRLPLWEAAKMRPAGKSGSSKAAFAVSMALLRRSTTPRLEGPTRRMPVRAQVSRRRLSRTSPSRAGFREAVGEHGRHLDPEAAAFLDRLDRGLRRRHDVGVVGDLRQRRERGPCALAQHLLAPGIDGIDAPRIAHLAQEFQRPPGGLAGVVGLPDDGDAVRREQRLAQIGMCRGVRRRGPLRTGIARQIVRGHITLRIDGSQRPGMQDSASNITHIASERRAGRTKKMRCPKRKSAL